MTRSMRRKTSTVPTRVFSYGLLAPLLNGDRVHQQLFLGHRYQNGLVEIERKRRESYSVITADATKTALRAQMEVSAERLEVIRKNCAKRNSDARKKLPKTPEERTECKHLLAERKRIALQLREYVNKKMTTDATVFAAIEESDERAHQATIALRKEFSAGSLYWGTYLLREQAMMQVRSKRGQPPLFKRFTGVGAIGVQLQNEQTVRATFEGTSTLLQIDRVPDDTFNLPRGARRLQSRTKVRFRIGSEGPGNRKPIWAEFPMILHRPLPPDGIVKWAKIIISKRGTTTKYELQLTIEAPSFMSNGTCGTVTAAIDAGWRTRPDGSIRFGYLADSEGAHHELTTPGLKIRADGSVSNHGIVNRIKHAREIRSMSDDLFNEHRDLLHTWITQNGNIVPEALKDKIKSLSQWRSAGRLGAAIWFWQANRFPGDEDIFEVMNQWRRQNRHLYQWERNEEGRARSHRKDYYRCLARKLTAKYGTIVLEDLDLSKLAKGKVAGDNRQAAAVSEFRIALAQAAAKTGTEIVSVPAYNTSRQCNACGFNEPWQTRSELTHACQGCGAIFDRDWNAAQNILAAHLASSSVTPKYRESLAATNDNGFGAVAAAPATIAAGQ